MTKIYTGLTLDEAFDQMQSAQQAYHMALMTTLERVTELDAVGSQLDRTVGTAPSDDPPETETKAAPTEAAPTKAKGRAKSTKPPKPLRNLPKPQAQVLPDPEPGNPATDANIQKAADVPGQADKGNGFDPAMMHEVPWEVVLQHSKEFMDKYGGEALSVLIKERYNADKLSQIPEASRAEYLNVLAHTEMN